MKTPKLPEDLVKKQLSLKAEIDKFVEETFVGKRVKWKDDGRAAVITRAHWDFDDFGDELEICVLVRVKTEKKNGEGYLDDNDRKHRTYRDVYRSFDWIKP